MRILIIDVDSTIPNIALMKISKFHKDKDDSIKFIKLNYPYYGTKRNIKLINSNNFDKVYVSIIFNVNKNVLTFNNKENVIIGGSGFDVKCKLPEEIEEIKDYDYSIYNENKTSYGFLTRGCIRNCKFCIVPEKEGLIHQVNKIDDIFKFKQIKFLDNNILSFENHKEILKELINKNIKCQFNQGLDIRLLDEENCELLSKLNYLGEYLFAFDDIRFEKIINEKLQLFKRFVSKDWKYKFYIYCNPEMNIQNDIFKRINWCKDNKCLPYLMRDVSCFSSNKKNFFIDLSSYCNQPSFFKKLSFEEYLLKRHKKENRLKFSLNLYRGIKN